MAISRDRRKSEELDMMKKRKSNHGRRYSDCAPSQLPSDPRRFSGGSIGPVIAGFDHYGYPIIQNFRLPAPYHLSEGDRFSATALNSGIMPMKLADAHIGLRAGIAKVDKFRLKPSPTVPAAPRDLPDRFDFCVQKGAEGYFLRCRNAKNPLHGAVINVGDFRQDEHGMIICEVNMPGSGDLASAPLCEEVGADKESIPMICCVKSLGDTSGQIVCPGSSYDLLIVKIVTTETIGGIRIASVQHLDLPGGGARLPICDPIDEVPEERPCCIEEGTGTIICPEGMNFPLAGKKIPIQYLEFVDYDGIKVARLRCGDINNILDDGADPILNSMRKVCEELGGYIFPVCAKKSDHTKPSRFPTGKQRVPDICCYDPETGTLICEGTEYHNLPVSVVAEVAIDGICIVSVAHDHLPGGGIRVPICPPKHETPRLPPANCCVNESSTGMILSCDPVNHPWNGRDVTGSGQCIETPNGRFCVLRWEDSYGLHTLEVPICPSLPQHASPHSSAADDRDPDPIPYLPPPSVAPTDGCEGEEAKRCRERWDEMVSRPAKFTKCDEKWFKIVERFKSGCGGPGRRASSMGINSGSRRYGTGINPENLQYGRFPGLRGGRKIV